MTVHDGERLVPGRCPLLVFEGEGEPDRKLVVFLPGAVHLGRVAYGHPGCVRTDFVAHWFAERGVPFLACSYPARPGEPVFPSVDPTLELADVTEAVAACAAATVAARALPREVVVVAWSALGNSAPLLRRALADRGIELGTFVSLAATPPLPNLILGSLDTTTAMVGSVAALTPDGLLDHRRLRSEGFLRELAAIADRQGRPVIDEASYRRYYLADMPLNVFPGLEARLVDGVIEVGHAGPLGASAGARWADYPLSAAICPTDPIDARHVVTDRHNWAMVNAGVIHWRLLAGVAPTSLDDGRPGRWDEVVAVSHELASTLHRSVEGGHFLFLGADGARDVVAAVLALDQRRSELEGRLRALLDQFAATGTS